MWIFASVALASPSIVYYDELPDTLNPLYLDEIEEIRAAELVFDRLFYRGVIT